MLRLKYYNIRKEYIINLLEKQCDILKNKYTYINEVLKGSIDLRKKTSQDIQEVLENKHYIKVENTFNYLIKMSMDSVCEDNVLILKKEYEDKCSELTIIKNTTIQQMWIKELTHLEKFL